VATGIAIGGARNLALQVASTIARRRHSVHGFDLPGLDYAFWLSFCPTDVLLCDAASGKVPANRCNRAGSG
jgi:hypothetical protein